MKAGHGPTDSHARAPSLGGGAVAKEIAVSVIAQDARSIAAPAGGTAGRPAAVTLRVGAETYGLDVLAVREVCAAVGFESVPGATGAGAGVLNVRGRVVPAVDLRRRLGASAGAEPGHAVVVEVGGRSMALIADGAAWAGAGGDDAPVTPLDPATFF